MNQVIFEYLFSLTHRLSWLDSFSVFLAQNLVWLWIVVLVAVAILFMNRPKTWEAFIFSASVAVISWSASELSKILFGGARPFVNLPAGSTLLTYGGNDAFPSSHAAFLFALAAAVYFYNRPLGIVTFIVAVLVSLARVATGLHWPVDIFGGFLLALVVTLLLRYWQTRKLPKRQFSL